MDGPHDDLRWRSAAIELVLDRRDRALARQSNATIPLDACGGRVLAEPIEATAPSPPTDIATMDGYAFDATDEYPLRLWEEEVFPESKPPSLPAGEAIPIATGAPLPPTANAVLKREDSEKVDGQLHGEPIEPGTYVYQEGSNVAAGEQLFAAGEHLSPKDAILLGDLDRETVTVTERFSVGVLATGSEIHEGRQRDLDSAMLAGLVRSWGHKATYEGTVPDEYDAVTDAVSRLAVDYDVVVTTGGTSVGHKDHVVQALADLGNIHFHRVRIRPGKPIALATVEDGKSVAFAIPGKPLGAHTVATLVMGPFFTGETTLPTQKATMAVDLDLGPDGFEYAIPVSLADGRAVPVGHPDADLSVYEDTFDPSVLSSSTRATRADGIILTTSPLMAEATVDVVPYPVIE